MLKMLLTCGKELMAAYKQKKVAEDMIALRLDGNNNPHI